MIRLRLSAFEKDLKDLEIAIIEEELLSQGIVRLLSDTKITEDPKSLFQVVVNGHVIDSDLWDFTKLTARDNVLVAPKIASGDGSQTFRQILTIVAVAVISVYVPGAAGFAVGSLGAALSVAGASILAVYAIGALIPPPVIGDGLNGGANFSDSQMYSISSQANAVRKFGTVPKVYGTHKVFPVVVANPYTELEADPTTGKLSQYLYTIYDFGLGSAVVSNLKIGDTPIESYSDVSYRFVDFNKPTISEGIWDDLTFNKLQYYKGSVTTENVSVTLNSNQNAGGNPSEYEVVRTASENPNNVSQEIALNFVCPQGLFAFSSTNARSPRAIDVNVFFSKVGENNWKPYNDLTYVSSYRGVGGDTQTKDVPVIPYSLGGVPQGLSLLFNLGNPIIERYDNYGQPMVVLYEEVYGLQWFDQTLLIEKGSGITIGDTIKFGDLSTTSVYLVISANPLYDTIVFNFMAPRASIIFYSKVIRFWQVAEYDSLGNEIHPAGYTETPAITDSYKKVAKRKADIPGRLRIYGETQEPYYATVRFTPKTPGQYKVKVTRVSSSSVYYANISDALSFATINTRSDSAPIITTKRHVFLEMRIRATGQLNGTIQNLSGIASSVLDVYNGTAWVKQQTANPAWVFADLLTGEVNKKPVAKSRLHTPSLVEWANYCNAVPTSGTLYRYVEKRFTSNFILDFKTTLQQLLGQVAGAAQASLNLIDGKYGVLLDVKRNSPVQIFTPRNTSGFNSSRIYKKSPDAVKVTYVDPNSSWQPNELVVYGNGKTVLTAVDFDSITTFGVTGSEQAFRFGRYFLAQHSLRQETISIKVDFEYLVCTRGDFVTFVQDVMKVGGTPAKVKSIVGNRIVIDEGLETGIGSYGYTFRSSQTGLIYTSTLTVVSADTFDLVGTPLPKVGDLVIIGIVGQLVLECIVKSISPDDNLTASLILVERAKEIYDIESIDLIPGYNALISENTDPEFGTPSEVQNLVVVKNFYDITQSGYEYYIDLDWDSPLGSAYDIFEVYVDYGGGYDLVTSTKNSDYHYTVNIDKLGELHSFKILAVSATGKKLGLGQVTAATATPIKKTTLPSNITTFNADITNETIQLFWVKINDLDVKEYVIRFNPSVSGGWEQSTSLMRVSSNTNLIATQARVGTYLVKASDFNGNESAIAAAVITTIPSLNNLNVISVQNDFPGLIGSMDQVVKDGSVLILGQSVVGTPGNEQYYSEGYYYYDQLLDLGDIYSVRLQSLIKAEGLVSTDIMANWPTLDSVLVLYSVSSSDWDVEAQYRATDNINVIEDWITLSSIVTISGGSEDKYTAWKKFIVGDATGRIFQFRLKLISNQLAVTPRVLDGEIRADMTDRIENLNNIVALSTGYTAVYSPGFAGPGTTPNVQITIENGQSGDYYTFTSKSLNGFTIVFYDKINNAVSRQFDAQIKGYGKKSITSL